MTAVSPRLDRRLLDAAEALDDPREPYAATWRRVGVVAEQLGLVRPGYDSIRLALRAHRRRRQEFRRLVEPVLVDVLEGRFTGWDAERLSRAREATRT